VGGDDSIRLGREEGIGGCRVLGAAQKSPQGYMKVYPWPSFLPLTRSISTQAAGTSHPYNNNKIIFDFRAAGASHPNRALLVLKAGGNNDPSSQGKKGISRQRAGCHP